MSSVQAKLISDVLTWNDNTSSLVDTLPVHLPTQPTSSVMPHPSIINPSTVSLDINPDPIDIPSRSETLMQSIAASTDCLFLMQYTPSNAAIPLWYIVQAHPNQSNRAISEGLYFCTCLMRYPTDSSKSVNKSHW